ncbi:MAG: serine/threonine-protein kinase, partial [Halobacteria archaeon]
SVCGKEISPDEAGGVGRGDYVCADCREMPKEREADLLEQILADFLRGKEKLPEIPDYEIVRELGQGGMGVVYLARRLSDSKKVALKVMLSKRGRVTEKLVKYFQREMEICRQLRHPNIVEFYEQGYNRGIFYFVMEYCNGGSLRDLMRKRGGRLDLDEAKPIMLQVLDGLAYAHEREIVHRDLKPENILLVIDAGKLTAKVSDFGLAKNFQQAGLSGMTASGAYAGTRQFMPREQLLDFKHARPVTDVFSIGATFYNMLTGEYVYDFSRAVDPVRVILEGQIVPIRKREVQLPEKLAEIIDRAISPEPKDRFQNAVEMKEEMIKVV